LLARCQTWIGSESSKNFRQDAEAVFGTWDPEPSMVYAEPA
jgi:hypothetical protein